MNNTRIFIKNNKTPIAFIGIISFLSILITINESEFYRKLTAEKRAKEYREKVLQSPFYYVDEGSYQTTEKLLKAQLTSDKFDVEDLNIIEYDDRIIDFQFTSTGLIIDYPYEWQDLHQTPFSLHWIKDPKRYSHVQEIIKFNPIFTRRIPDSLNEPTTIYEIEIAEWYIKDMVSEKKLVDVLNTYTDSFPPPSLVLYCNSNMKSTIAFRRYGMGISPRFSKHGAEIIKGPKKNSHGKTILLSDKILSALKLRGFMTIDERSLLFENGRPYHPESIPDYHQKSKLEEW